MYCALCSGVYVGYMYDIDMAETVRHEVVPSLFVIQLVRKRNLRLELHKRLQ